MFQYQGGNMMRGAALEQQKQQSFFDNLARQMGMMQEQKRHEDRTELLKRELDMKGNDPQTLADAGFMTLANGGTPTPEQMAAMKVVDAQSMSKVKVDQYGNQIRNDSIFDLLGAQAGLNTNVPVGHQNGGIYGGAPSGGFNTAQIEGVEKQPLNAPVIRNKAEEMAYQQKLDLEKSEQQAKIQENKETRQRERKKTESSGKIGDILNELYRLNDDLKADGALVTTDGGFIQNTGAQLATMPLVGKAVQSSFDPKTQSKRNEYEKLRDSLIPYYIEANDLPATVVDTEEFQQRILSAFGDPSSDYDSNKAALESMARQFGVEVKGGNQKKSSPQNKQLSRRERALEILRQRGKVQ